MNFPLCSIKWKTHLTSLQTDSWVEWLARLLRSGENYRSHPFFCLHHLPTVERHNGQQQQAEPTCKEFLASHHHGIPPDLQATIFKRKPSAICSDTFLHFPYPNWITEERESSVYLEAGHRFIYNRSSTSGRINTINKIFVPCPVFLCRSCQNKRGPLAKPLDMNNSCSPLPFNTNTSLQKQA